jgi:phage replication O-like protein O
VKDFTGFPAPQYTRTPNLIFDQFLNKLSGSQLKVLLFFVRTTMGWQKDHEFIPAAMDHIEEATGLSRSSIAEAINALEEGRLILRKKTRGEEGRQGISEYRLRFADDTDEEIPESKKSILESRVDFLGKKVNSGTDPSFSVLKKAGKDTPLPPPTTNSESENPAADTTIGQMSDDADLNLEDDILTFVENAYRRGNHRAKLDKLRAKSSEVICNAVRRAEEERGAAAFRRAVIVYLNHSDDWLIKERWPIRHLLKYVDRYLPADLVPIPARLSPRHASAEASEDANQHPASADSMAGSLPPVAAIPYAAQEWNRVVTAAPPVEAWTKRDRSLDSAAADPDFISALPRVLEACQLAFQNKPPEEIDWLSFHWLLKAKRGESENWYRIARGEMNWMKHRRDAGGKPKKVDLLEEVRRENAERVAEIRRARAASTGINIPA